MVEHRKKLARTLRRLINLPLSSNAVLGLDVQQIRHEDQVA